MLLLSLFWLLIGVLIGILANAAKLWSVGWVWSRCLAGALAALAGGWLGVWVFGSLFGTATAVWIAVLAVMVVPCLIDSVNVI